MREKIKKFLYSCVARSHEPKEAPPELVGRRQLIRGATFAGVATVMLLIFALAPEIALAKKKSGGATLAGVDILTRDSIANRPLLLMTTMGVLALLPFVGMMVTSFVKIAVVLSITRQALGTQQAPPPL